MNSRRARRLSALVIAGLVVAACGSDSKSTTSGSTGASSGSSASSSAGAYAVDTADCPPEATKKIEGTIKIGSTMPLSGGVATAFAPVKSGLQSYINYANEQKLVPGYTLALSIEDDQYNPALTTPAVAKLLDQTGVNIISGIVGSPNNAAVRDTLNQDCVPQLNALSGLPAWGDAENHPWTTGGLYTYNTEARIYLESIKKDYPQGAKAAIFRVNSDFGKSYDDAYKKYAADAKVTIVDDQTIEATDSAPPASQITSIASKTPDVILASPLGAGCITFLGAVANAKAANPAFNPRIYITATCASALILGVAGAAADGIYTTASIKDVADPKNAADPEVVLFKNQLTGVGFSGDVSTAGAGWVAGEATVKALIAAAKSPDGLTRASIINAARALDFHPKLNRDGVDFKMNGTEDPFPTESLQVIQFQAATKTYKEIGSLITEFEGKTTLN
jgi:ABC-type branched-subunit amino acid transport system substrate-binding protein